MKKEDFWKHIEEDEVHTIQWCVQGGRPEIHTGLIWRYSDNFVGISLICDKKALDGRGLLHYEEIRWVV